MEYSSRVAVPKANSRPQGLAAKHRVSSTWIMAVILAVAALFSFTLGHYHVSIQDLLVTLLSPITGEEVDSMMYNVVFRTRLPRIFVAIVIGCGLSVSGASYQGLFRNPMVSPDLLGASAGAGLGAALGLLFDFSSVGVQLCAFALGIVAVEMSVGVSSAISRSSHNVLSLVLTGMVVSALFQAFISMLKYLADPVSKLPAITFWLMGGLTNLSIQEIPPFIIPVLIGGVPLFLFRWRINTLSFGDEEARLLGIDPKKMRILVIVCSTLITAACVSVGGLISWVGLVIPHLARMIVGPNYKHLLPASCLLGGIFLLIVDDIARSVLTSELPLSILTAVIGAPFFIYLLLKGKKAWL